MELKSKTILFFIFLFPLIYMAERTVDAPTVPANPEPKGDEGKTPNTAKGRREK